MRRRPPNAAVCHAPGSTAQEDLLSAVFSMQRQLLKWNRHWQAGRKSSHPQLAPCDALPLSPQALPSPPERPPRCEPSSRHPSGWVVARRRRWSLPPPRSKNGSLGPIDPWPQVRRKPGRRQFVERLANSRGRIVRSFFSRASLSACRSRVELLNPRPTGLAPVKAETWSLPRRPHAQTFGLGAPAMCPILMDCRH